MSNSAADIAVSHLPTSASFYASVLQPLGYRFLEHCSGQIKFAIPSTHPVLSISQAPAPLHFARSHITISAPSRSAIDKFSRAAILAGGTAVGSLPQSSLSGIAFAFSSTILDPDGHVIEVGSMSQHSAESARVLRWQKDVARSTASSATVTTPCRQARDEPQIRSLPYQQPSHAIYISQPAPPPPQVYTIEPSPMGSSKALLGTLLGAAAGATFAYAMTKAEALDDQQTRQREQQQAFHSRGTTDPHQATQYAQRALPAATAAVSAARSPTVETITNFLQHVSIPDAAPPYSAPPSQQRTRPVQLLEAGPSAPSVHTYTPSRSARLYDHNASAVSTARGVPLPAPAYTSYSAASQPTIVSRRSGRGEHSRAGFGPVAVGVDDASVAPSESVSQVGSGGSGRRHRSRRTSTIADLPGKFDVVRAYEVESAASGRSRRSRRSGMGRS